MPHGDARSAPDPTAPAPIVTTPGGDATSASARNSAGAAVAPRPTLVPCPPKAPEWFVEGHAAITKVDLGPHFDALVAAWTRLEAASCFQNGPTNLPSRGRPKQVGTWIAGGRGKRGKEPKVTDPAAYAVEWQAWWDSLQPAWREKGLDGRWSWETGYGADNEWGALMQWGVNGSLSILASLYFWGCAVVDDPAGRVAWDAAACDVGWMLEGLALYYEKFKGRW
ncbi:hypothetical protein B0H11DRAFT_1738317 [Mycena galericulata]|nr:hypothetical protein B0H11DRAFT_1738317 [Mycena galericulata]